MSLFPHICLYLNFFPLREILRIGDTEWTEYFRDFLTQSARLLSSKVLDFYSQSAGCGSVYLFHPHKYLVF